MKNYLIKVLWLGEEIVFRDLKASENHSLLDLHLAIVDAFHLSGDQLAGFTKFDESLQIEADYQLEAFDENSSLMADVPLKEVIEIEGDTLDYTYDFLHEVKFTLEVLEIVDEAPLKKIEVGKAKGELPKDLFSEVDPDDAEGILMQALLKAEGLDEEEGDEDFFDQDEFNSLDDYEEYQ